MMSYEEQQQMVAAAVAQLPEEFGLRAFPGERFRPLLHESYVNNSGEVLVYIGIVKGEMCLPFDKDTVRRIQREMVR